MLNQLAENIWVVDGGSVPFFCLPYTTRMTVIRLENNDLFINSPITLNNELMKEVVFFHKSSKTLILTDLIENFDENYFTGFKGLIAKLSGIVAPNGKTPVDWRVPVFLVKKTGSRVS